MAAAGFWVSNVPSQSDNEVFPGVFIHVLRKDRPTAFGALSAYYARVERDAFPHLPHRHMDQEIVLVHSGEIDLIEEQRTLRVGAGTLIHTGPMCSHSVRGASDQPACLFVLKWKGLAEAMPDSAAAMLDCDWRDRQWSSSRDRQEIASLDIGAGQRMVVALARCQAGARIEPHRHAHEVVEIVLEGELPGLGYRAQSPCISYFSAGSVHGMSKPCERDCVLLGLEVHDG